MSSINSKISKYFKKHLTTSDVDPEILKPFSEQIAAPETESFFTEPLASGLEPSDFEVNVSSNEEIAEMLTTDNPLLGKGLPNQLVRDLLKLRGELGEVDQSPEISDLIYVMY